MCIPAARAEYFVLKSFICGTFSLDRTIQCHWEPSKECSAGIFAFNSWWNLCAIECKSDSQLLGKWKIEKSSPLRYLSGDIIIMLFVTSCVDLQFVKACNFPFCEGKGNSDFSFAQGTATHFTDRRRTFSIHKMTYSSFFFFLTKSFLSLWDFDDFFSSVRYLHS